MGSRGEITRACVAGSSKHFKRACLSVAPSLRDRTPTKAASIPPVKAQQSDQGGQERRHAAKQKGRQRKQQWHNFEAKGSRFPPCPGHPKETGEGGRTTRRTSPTGYNQTDGKASTTPKDHTLPQAENTRRWHRNKERGQWSKRSKSKSPKGLKGPTVRR